jgi:hypothetical protein
MKHCPDCAVAPGHLHQEGCDVEQCPMCGGQFLSCWCQTLTRPRIPWSGEWPGQAECREFGWYALFSPTDGWVRCGADAPGAMPDLNRLHIEARWDADQQRFVLPPAPTVSAA